MKKKLIAGLVVFAALPFLAKAAPDIGFYLFIAVFIAIILLVRGKKSAAPGTSTKGEPGVDRGWKLRRIGKAVKEVRRNRMTVAEASAHFNVTEKEIKSFHYLDYLLTY